MLCFKNNDFSKADVQQIEAEAHDVQIPDTAERIPTDEFKKRLARIRREKARIQRELQERKQEIESFKITGNEDFLFNAAENQKLYGGL